MYIYITIAGDVVLHVEGVRVDVLLHVLHLPLVGKAQPQLIIIIMIIIMIIITIIINSLYTYIYIYMYIYIYTYTSYTYTYVYIYIYICFADQSSWHAPRLPLLDACCAPSMTPSIRALDPPLRDVVNSCFQCVIKIPPSSPTGGESLYASTSLHVAKYDETRRRPCLHAARIRRHTRCPTGSRRITNIMHNIMCCML